ncbi:hypothetical protein [Gordonia sp. 852002-10350_SCH5691597]|uniref:hypothetical protein n=1 Tax=Gordonia sp. 852002-10350_SCH5691597 TaxID=1834085 RepID=UPI0007EAF694|nr:hypothetical protein [Gordonia sp. 852002-10350_SCH5691597]OBA61424.1 hypothetical protein A5777_03300 [Gordonia sp. 852002-10350_SCH5691597]
MLNTFHHTAKADRWIEVKGQSRVISAYSPVTGMSYVMSCGPEGGVVACRGGNDAVVYVY